ncbi:hypothetical protein ADUPG1_014166, partial [Aduncisulcus paluster]
MTVSNKSFDIILALCESCDMCSPISPLSLFSVAQRMKMKSLHEDRIVRERMIKEHQAKIFAHKKSMELYQKRLERSAEEKRRKKMEKRRRKGLKTKDIGDVSYTASPSDLTLSAQSFRSIDSSMVKSSSVPNAMKLTKKSADKHIQSMKVEMETVSPSIQHKKDDIPIEYADKDQLDVHLTTSLPSAMIPPSDVRDVKYSSGNISIIERIHLLLRKDGTSSMCEVSGNVLLPSGMSVRLNVSE